MACSPSKRRSGSCGVRPSARSQISRPPSSKESAASSGLHRASSSRTESHEVMTIGHGENTALDLSMIGVEQPAVEFSWDERDIMLYALAVGAGATDPTEEIEFTTENSAVGDLVTLPTYANIITRSARVSLPGADPTRIV